TRRYRASPSPRPPGPRCAPAAESGRIRPTRQARDVTGIRRDRHAMKCDNCNKTATVHLTEIKGGKKIEKHLCEQCAAQNEGLPVKSHMPINELLTNFVMQHSGLTKDTTATTCEQCGITW